MPLLAKDANGSIVRIKRSGDGSVGAPFSEFSTALGDGRKTSTTPGTAVPLVASSTPCKRVLIRARMENIEMVVIGSSTVLAGDATDSGNTRRGIPLMVGEQPLVLEIDNLNKVYLDVITSGDGVTYVYEDLV